MRKIHTKRLIVIVDIMYSITHIYNIVPRRLLHTHPELLAKGFCDIM